MSNELADRLEELKRWLFDNYTVLDSRHVRNTFDEAIAALRSEPWIPVGERLPEEYLHILVWADGAPYPIIGYWAKDSFRQDSITEIEVTHWMPLPAAPSRETDQRSQNLDEMPLARAVRLARGHQGPPANPITFASSTSDHPTVEPALSAEQIESVRRILLSHYGFNNETDLQRRGNINDLCRMALSSLTARDEWKGAVIDELMVCHAYHAEHDNNPRKALKDAIHWNVQIALDPAVSEDAQKLRDEGIEAACKQVVEEMNVMTHTADQQRALLCAYNRIRALKGQP